MLARLTVTAILALLLAASPNTLGAEQQSTDDFTRALEQWNGKLRFPKDGLSPADPDSWSSDNRYSSFILDGLDERALFDQVVSKNIRIIRLTILPSFSPAMVARVESSTERTLLVFKLGNSGGWGPVTSRDELRIELSDADRKDLFRQLEKSRICDRGYSKRIGLDGWTWILEYKDAEQYCVYQEWSPEGGFFYEIFKIVRLAIGTANSRIGKIVKHY